MAHLTNFSFEFFYKIFTEDASLPLLYHGAKKSKMTKNPNQGGGGSCLKKALCPNGQFKSGGSTYTSNSPSNAAGVYYREDDCWSVS